MTNRSKEILQTLKAEIQLFLSRVNELDSKLIDVKLGEAEKEEDLIALGYYLSGIYSCFESAFFKIASVFENRVDTPSSWHRDLLQRMIISVEGIRPNIISKESFILLDELRGFRNVFRSSYMFELDLERLNLLLSKWKRGKDNIIRDIQDFCNYLLADN
jgi:uncharacterized protein YutE (UPF0331/DUF86 family)